MIVLVHILLFVVASECIISQETAVTHLNKLFWSWNTLNEGLEVGQGAYSYGVVSRRGPIEANKVIMEVPLSATLCLESIEQRPYGKVLLASESITESDKITLAILTEYASGIAAPSSFYYWLRAVPNSTTLIPPFLWPLDIISQMEPKSLRKEVEGRISISLQNYKRVTLDSKLLSYLKKYVKQLRNEWKEKLDRDRSRRSIDAEVIDGEEMDEDDEDKDPFRLERYNWAQALLDSRGWNMNGHVYFVPVADMFNHRESSDDREFNVREKIFFSFRSQKFLETHTIVMRSGGSSVFRIKSDQAAKQGEELFESYGDNPNEIYFQFHGFVPDVLRNRYDCEKVDIASWPTSQLDWQYGKWKHNLWKQFRFFFSSTVCLSFDYRVTVELNPLVMIPALVDSLPMQISTPLLDCCKAAAKAHGFGNSYRHASSTYKTLVQCLLDNFHGGEDALQQLLRRHYDTAQKLLMAHFRDQYISSNVVSDEELLSRLVSRSSGSNDVSVQRRIVVLRLKISRKHILRQLLTVIKNHREDLATIIGGSGEKDF